VKDRKFDGFIVTGAPIAHLDFKDVGYWDEMVDIMNWTRTNVHTTMFVCWGAQAALHHFYNVQRFRRPKKAFGVYRHQAATHASPYLLGFSDDFAIPVSRINDIDHASVPDNLEVLINSKEVGLCLLNDPEHRQLFMLNHLEYDHKSLVEEYLRDKEAGIDTPPPVNTFPNDDITQEPLNRWRSHAYLLFGNWINQLYQTTEYDLNKIGTK
jgi:homoserine O-succinyltransferase